VLERASFWSGRFPLAIRYAEQAVDALVQAGDRWWEGQSRWMIGWSHGAMGEFELALAAVTRAGEVGEAIRDPRLPCYAAWTSAVILAMRGDGHEAIAAGRRGLERSTDRLNTGVALGFTGFACLQAGEIEEAIPMLVQGAESMEEMAFRPLQGWFTIWWGEALLQKREHDRAEEVVRRGMEVCQGVRNLWGVGMAQRVLGCIALEKDDLEAASRRLEEAEKTLTPLEARYWIARVAFDRAELGMRSGCTEDAARALEQARSIFSALGSDHWLRQTEARTVALNSSPGRTA
jgi:tetratricopeptide (TPR) repeat protein